MLIDCTCALANFNHTGCSSGKDMGLPKAGDNNVQRSPPAEFINIPIGGILQIDLGYIKPIYLPEFGESDDYYELTKGILARISPFFWKETKVIMGIYKLIVLN